MSKTNQIADTVARGFAQALDYQGFSFQHAVLSRIRDLCNKTDLPWVFEASEFPAEVRSLGTRIDFILRHRWGRLYLACECKRTDPAISDWCFVKAPFVRRRHQHSAVIIDEVREDNGIVLAGAHVWDHLTEVYHLGLEVKRGEKGDGSGAGRNAIEQTAGQVLKGANGLAQLFSTKKHLLDQPCTIGAVIFTTANLWVSDVNISTADITTGKLDASTLSVTPKEWLAFNYHLSPGIKHEIPSGGAPRDLSAILGEDYTRTIMIVSASGIQSFLNWTWT